ncbi:hypothetical protein H4R35_000766 [Dimargaris xerosporica]|nr:hypothetical protein H4R35_000766 [Dimargaris xerosporica]
MTGPTYVCGAMWTTTTALLAKSAPLPTVKPMGDGCGFQEHSATLAAELQSRLTTVAWLELALLGWGILASRYLDTDFVTVGHLDGNRLYDAKVYPQLVPTGSDQSVRDVHTWLQANRNCTLELPAIAELCDLSPSAHLTDTLIAVNEYAVPAAPGTLASSWIPTMVKHSCSLLLVMVTGPNECTIQVVFNQRVYPRVAIEQLTQQLVTITSTLLATLPNSTQPEAHLRMKDVAWVSTEEHALLFRLGSADLIFPSKPERHRPIQDLFGQWVNQSPHQLAVIDGDRTLTYRELNQCVHQLAGTLQTEYQVTREVRVAFLGQRSLEATVAIMAIVRAGGAFILIDNQMPTDRVAFILEDSQTHLLLTTHQSLDRVPGSFSGRILEIDDCYLVDNDLSVANICTVIQPHDLVYIVYTSGTTGTPKGIMIEHQSLINLVTDPALDSILYPGARVLQFFSIGFDAYINDYFGALTHGNTLVLMGSDPYKSLQLVDIVPTTPSFWAKFSPGDFPNVKTVCFGGEACPKSLIDRWGDQCRLYNFYGPSETTIICQGTEHFKGQPVTIGRPLANVFSYVIDQNLQLVPLGVVGELLIGGMGVARGYCNLPKLTAERFFPNPFGPGRVYRTGDLVRWLPSGNLEYLGRRDNQVKLNGFRIELDEIESVVGQCSQVQQAAAVVHHNCLLCFVTPELSDFAPLVDHLRQTLPHYMVPHTLVALAQFPTTVNGKVNRRALADLDLTSTSHCSLVADSTALDLDTTLDTHVDHACIEQEAVLRQAWVELLDVPLDRIARQAHFFRLGGDSIVAILLVSKCRQQGYQLTVPTIYAHPVLASLAKQLVSLNAATTNTALYAQTPITGPVPLTPIQQWFFGLPLRNPHHFNQSFLLKLSQPVGATVIQDALVQLLTHHDMLRCRYTQHDNQWQQTIPTTEATHDDFGWAECHTTEAELSQHLARLHTQLNLTQGPLFGALLIHLDTLPDQPRLYLVSHHVVIDLVSWRILIDDLNTLLTHQPLPPKTLSFAQWAISLDAHAATLSADCWPEQVPPADAVEPSPVDQVGTRHAIFHTLDADTTDRLVTHICPALRVTPRDAILSTYALAYCQALAVSQVNLCMEGHGREPWSADLDISRTVGWFTSFYPLVLHAQRNASLTAVLHQVKERLQQIPTKGFSYFVLKYMANARADERNKLLAKTPARLDVLFNYFGRFTLLPSATKAMATIDWSERVGEHDLPATDWMPFDQYVMAIINGDTLRLGIDYNTCRCTNTTMTTLLSTWTTLLRDLVCSATVQTAALVPITTRFDFDSLVLTAKDFEQITTQLAQRDISWRDVEDIYSCTPLQSGLLLATQRNPHAYIVQCTLELHGKVDAGRLQTCWEQIALSHSILRTVFLESPSQSVTGFVQVVLNCPIVRLSIDGSSVASQSTTSIDQPKPLGKRAMESHALWVSITPSTTQTLTSMQITFHHALLDGWSMRLLVSQVLSLYHGALTAPLESTHFKPVVSKLMSNNMPVSQREFWQTYLKNAPSTPAPLIHAQFNPDSGYNSHNAPLAIAKQSLLHFVRKHTVSMSTVLRAAYAIFLARCLHTDDVVFGTIVSGRNLDLDNITSIIGPCINTVPFRVRLGNEPIVEWLQRLHRDYVQLIPHEQASMVDVTRWSDIPIGTRLVNTIMGFESQPTVPQSAQDLIQIADITIEEYTEYPLSVTFDEKSDAIWCKVLWARGMYDAQVGSDVVMFLTHILEQIQGCRTTTLVESIQLLSADRGSQTPHLRDQGPVVVAVVDSHLDLAISILATIRTLVSALGQGCLFDGGEGDPLSNTTTTLHVTDPTDDLCSVVCSPAQVVRLVPLLTNASRNLPGTNDQEVTIQLYTVFGYQQRNGAFYVTSATESWSNINGMQIYPQMLHPILRQVGLEPVHTTVTSDSHLVMLVRNPEFDPTLYHNRLTELLPEMLLPCVMLSTVVFPHLNRPLGQHHQLEAFAMAYRHVLQHKDELVTEVQRWLATHWIASGHSVGNPTTALTRTLWELGGNLVDLMRLCHRINTKFGIALSIADMMPQPRFSAIGALIDAALVAKKSEPMLAPTVPSGHFHGLVLDECPVTAAQLRTWCQTQSNHSIDGWYCQRLYRLDGGIDERYLHQAFAWLITSRDRLLALTVGEPIQSTYASIRLHPLAGGHTALDAICHGFWQYYACLASDKALTTQYASVQLESLMHAARHEQQLTMNAQTSTALAYWHRLVANVSPITNLPTDHTYDSEVSHQVQLFSYTPSNHTCLSIEKAAAADDIEPCTAWLSLLGVYFARITRQPDVLLGVQLARTLVKSTSHSPTDRISLLFVSHHKSDDTLSEVLRQTQRQIDASMPHAIGSLEWLVQALGLNHNPLIDKVPHVVVEFRCKSAQCETWSSVCPIASAALGRIPFAALTLVVDIGKQSTTITAQYSLDDVSPELVHNLLANFDHFAGHVLAAPTQLHVAPLSRPDETRTLLADFAQGPVLNTFDACWTPDGEIGNIVRLVQATASASPALPALDYSGEITTYHAMIHQVNMVAMAMQAHGVTCQSRVAALVENRPTTAIQFTELTPTAPNRLIPDPGPTYAPNDLIYIIFTSGTTGQPKGVPILYQGLRNRIYQDPLNLCPAPGTRLLHTMGVGFDASIFAAVQALCRQGTLVFNTGDLISVAQRVHTALLTPSMLSALNPQTHANLQSIATGGEALPAPLAHRWAEHCPVFNGYGPSEITIISHAAQVHSGQPITIGRPVPNTSCYILDPHKNVTPVGVVGEIHIGGPGVSPGYLNRPDLNPSRFIPNPFGSGKLYATGDLGRWLRSGDVECLGRIDNQVKVRGHRIELTEVTNALLAQPKITTAVVQVYHSQLVAFVGPMHVDSQELLAALAKQLPHYMVPSHILTITAVPQTANGKIDTRALEARFAQYQEEQQIKDPTAIQALPPQTKALQHGVAQVLGLNQTTVNLDLSFVQLGGDSISAIQLSAQLKQLGYALPIPDILQHMPLRTLAQSLKAGITTTTTRHYPEPASGTPVPLTPIQHEFFGWAFQNPHHFTQSMVLELTRPIPREHLDNALRQLLHHHGILCSRFVQSAQGTWTHLWAPQSYELDSLVDIIACDQNTLRSHLEMAQRRLNLEAGHLLRAALLQVSEAVRSAPTVLLFLTIHHLAVDLVSWRTILEDLHSLLQNQPLTPVPLPFGAWAYALWEWGSQLSTYATNHSPTLSLPSIDPASLPLNIEGNRQTTSFALSTSLSINLVELEGYSRRFGIKPTELLLAALIQTLHSLAGEATVTVWHENHGRHPWAEGLDLSRTIGWFTALYPVTLVVEDAWSPATVLQRVKHTLQTMPHHGLAYGIHQMHRGSGGDRSSYQPMGVVFNYLGKTTDQAILTLHGQAPWVVRSDLTHVLSACDANERRPQLLEILAYQREKSVWFDLQYCPQVVSVDIITALTIQLPQVLGDMITCYTSDAETLYWTPEDFSQLELTWEDLDTLHSELKRRQIEPADVEDVYPMLRTQQSLLAATLKNPSQYTVQTAMTVQGVASPDQLRQAFQQVIAHHSILRTRFLMPRAPSKFPALQVVLQPSCIEWQVANNWSSLNAHDEDDYMQQNYIRGFHADAPPLRCVVVAMSNQALRLVITMHHAIIDGWSFSLLLGELLQALHCPIAYASNDAYIAFGDYVRHVRQLDGAVSHEFWCQHLRCVQRPTILAPAQAPGGKASMQAHIFPFINDVSEFHRIAHAAGFTTNVILKAAWALVLYAHSRQPSVVFGHTMSGRNLDFERIEHLIGCLISTIPFCVQVDRAMTVQDLLHQVLQASMEMTTHGHYHVQDIAHWTQLESTGAPLFNTLLVYENYPKTSLMSADHAITLSNVRFLEDSEHDLAILAEIDSNTLAAYATWNSCKFNKHHVEGLVHFWHELCIQLLDTLKSGTCTCCITELCAFASDSRHWGLE